jgi:cell wall-associated NlpC family hydrolase
MAGALKLAALTVLLTLAAAPARAQTRQSLLEYVTAALRKDNALSAADQARMVSAIKERFADYANRVVRAEDTSAADVVMRMIIEGTFDETPPERIADVAFAAYQAAGRGAPADVVEGIALYGYRKKIPGDRIATWANGYKNLTDAKVPPEVAADLVRNAMEKDWDDRTFSLLKQAMYQAAKERLDARAFAIYLMGNMQAGAKPGALSAEALSYFRKCARTKTAPKLPAYEGVFAQKPAEAAPRNVPIIPDAPAVPVAPARTVTLAEPPASAKPALLERQAETPAPAKTISPERALAMAALWPGLEATAVSYLGTPYVWGGVTHKGIDCSAFTQNTYGENRVGIPRVSRAQWKTGKPVEWRDLREGDLVFFNTMGVGVSHVGLVMDPKGPRFMHASSSRGVVRDDLTKRYYKTRYLGARRIVP